MADNQPAASAPKHDNVVLKLILELGPLIVFFIGNTRGEWLAKTFPVIGQLGQPLFIATGLYMVATLIALAVSKAIYGKLAVMPMISGIVVVVFGLLAIWLQNDVFVFMKPTIINTLFGVILLVGLLFGRSLLGYVFNSAFQLDDEGWRKLTLRWGIFFLFLAILNEVVWRGSLWYFAPDAKAGQDLWVNFKVWGTVPITMIFTLSQMPLIMKHSLEDQAK